MSDAIHHFFQYGAQYYLTGRFAGLTGQTPVAGNLMHHAIEMFLKGAISRSMPLPDMKGALGHRLKKTWQVFKQQINDASLDRFDTAIDTLDAFEEIRYPDEIMKKGVALQISIDKTDPCIPEFEGGSTVPHYMFSLEEVDELVAAIFKTASRNPAAYFFLLTEDAKSVLLRHNSHLSL